MSIGVLCGAFVVACAGGDTPARDDVLEDAIAQAYGDGTGVSGSGPAPSGGTGGRPPTGGTGGVVSQGGSDATSGAGGAPGGAGGMVGMAGSGAGECDGFLILQTKCNGPSCHGDGSPYSGFAASESDALTYIDEDPSGPACASGDPIITPDNPANSLIIQKLDGSMPCGSPMPLGPALSADEIQCIEDWIGTL